MKFLSSSGIINLELTRDELHLIYGCIYASTQFVDDVDFAAVSGHYKADAHQLLDAIAKILDSVPG